MNDRILQQSKAEERALEAYPFIDGEMSKTQNANAGRMYARNIFKKGYKQAEKDLELTWEDIASILDATDVIANDDSMEERLKTMSEEEYCQEVLRRFKDYKKGK